MQNLQGGSVQEDIANLASGRYYTQSIDPAGGVSVQIDIKDLHIGVAANFGHDLTKGADFSSFERITGLVAKMPATTAKPAKGPSAPAPAAPAAPVSQCWRREAEEEGCEA